MEKRGLLSATETKLLFSNISELVETNKKMATRFEGRRDEMLSRSVGLEHMLIGDIFIEMVREMA